MNAGWSAFGDVPVEIDYASLAGSNITQAQIQATQADVLILSNPGFFTYTAAEISAIRNYVKAGHGLIISYRKLVTADRYLAPLVGLSDTTELGSGTAIDPIEFEFLVSDHPLFADLGETYISGVPYLASPIAGAPWNVTTGVVLANRFSATMPSGPGIIANDAAIYRGLHFSHYPESLSGGSNAQDFQLFYNGIVWTSGVPEPHSARLVFMGLCCLIRCRGRVRALAR